MSKGKEGLDLGINSKKGMQTQKHWEIDVSRSVFPQGNDDEAKSAFLPRNPSDRPQPHVKINECDH